MEYCEDRNGTIVYIRAVQRHCHGVTINLTPFSLRKIPLSWKEHTFQAGSSSNYKSILESGQWAGGLSFEKHEDQLDSSHL